jgi:predicted PurR-regulated permease PerM
LYRLETAARIIVPVLVASVLVIVATIIVRRIQSVFTKNKP